ncbi:MAG: C40 family peptidase [Blastocatellales bacterium]
MRKAYRLVVCFMAVFTMLVFAVQRADAQNRRQDFGFESVRPNDFGRAFTSETKLRTRLRPSKSEREVEAEIEALLYGAIMDRIGAPYRSNGTDDRGYDCSGFVWRVFQETGFDFSRSSARRLWATLPEATEDEQTQFGTLVFFKGLNHVGIVRDAYSFYHASTSQGVVRSFYSGYWGDKVIGFRRVPLPRNLEVIRR